MIKVTSVKKMFGENVTAVEDLSFQINKGEIVGFVGQNSLPILLPSHYFTESLI